jgi:hypothetical protein
LILKLESFFSIADYTLGDRRLAILPTHIEEQLFLKINRHFWNAKAVIALCKKVDAEEDEVED